MIDFRDRSLLAANVVTLASVAVLASTLVFMLVVPKPTTKGLAKERRDKEFKIKLDTEKARQRLAEAKAQMKDRVWTGSIERIGPVSLERIDKLAAKRRLKMIALRPQRTDEIADFTQVPLTVTVEGSFLDVMGFVKEVQAPENKLSVAQIQLASADGASDMVTLTIGLNAFAVPGEDKADG